MGTAANLTQEYAYFYRLLKWFGITHQAEQELHLGRRSCLKVMLPPGRAGEPDGERWWISVAVSCSWATNEPVGTAPDLTHHPVESGWTRRRRPGRNQGAFVPPLRGSSVSWRSNPALVPAGLQTGLFRVPTASAALFLYLCFPSTPRALKHIGSI